MLMMGLASIFIAAAICCAACVGASEWDAPSSNSHSIIAGSLFALRERARREQQTVEGTDDVTVAIACDVGAIIREIHNANRHATV
jgi:hypothetical protein